MHEAPEMNWPYEQVAPHADGTGALEGRVMDHFHLASSPLLVLRRDAPVTASTTATRKPAGPPPFQASSTTKFMPTARVTSVPAGTGQLLVEDFCSPFKVRMAASSHAYQIFALVSLVTDSDA